MLSENDFEAVLATHCCYYYCTNPSEAFRRLLQVKEIIANTSRVHSHKKRKCSLETQGTLLIFSLELETSGLAVQSVHQNSKNGGFCEESLNEFACLVTLKMF